MIRDKSSEFYDWVVSDENSTRGKWPLGRVVQTFPDKFGHVRQVLVRTQNKTLKRSITIDYKTVQTLDR